MIYDQKITEYICEELKKIPNIRHVCKKVGIDHSTFYRWLGTHFEFNKKVRMAKFIGREGINDAAESVIINGVQNANIKCAIYWLSHNHKVYVAEERARYFEYLEDVLVEFLEKPIPPNSRFEILFDFRFLMETTMGEEFANNRIEPFVEAFFPGDPELCKIFHQAYAEWKTNKLDQAKRIEEIKPYIKIKRKRKYESP